jgi:hypothetical protein
LTAFDAEPPTSGQAGWYSDPLGREDIQRWFNGSTWTDRIQKVEPPTSWTPKKRAWWRPGWRKMTWTLLIFSVLMLIWIISAAGGDAHCARETYRGACELGQEAGRGIAVGLLIVLWFIGFVILSLIWFMTRPKGRECPVCGDRVRKGRTVCSQCSYDFAAAANHEPRLA